MDKSQVEVLIKSNQMYKIYLNAIDRYVLYDIYDKTEESNKLENITV